MVGANHTMVTMTVNLSLRRDEITTKDTTVKTTQQNVETKIQSRTKKRAALTQKRLV